jgi:hypothetical protein
MQSSASWRTGSEVRNAYNSAQHLPERRWMMQAWADHLDTLRANAMKAAA